MNMILGRRAKMTIAFLAAALTALTTLTLLSFAADKDEEKENPNIALTISQRPYQEFAIKLKANHSRGYKWVLDKNFDRKLLEPLGTEFVRPKGGMEGADGTEVWSFRALGEGETVLSFKFAKPSQKELPATKTAVYTVKVKTPAPQ